MIENAIDQLCSRNNASPSSTIINVFLSRATHLVFDLHSDHHASLLGNLVSSDDFRDFRNVLPPGARVGRGVGSKLSVDSKNKAWDSSGRNLGLDVRTRTDDDEETRSSAVVEEGLTTNEVVRKRGSCVEKASEFGL